MDLDYDLFEIFPNGCLVWREVVSGHEQAILRLQQLSSETSNELRVVHLATKQVVAAINAALQIP